MTTRCAFVTGATGFLGRNLIDRLVDGAWRITAIHRAASDLDGLEHLPITWVHGDILDPASLVAAIPERADAVFHVAADTSMWSQRRDIQTRTNVEGTRNVVDAALDRRVECLVHTSSWNAYGLRDGPISEEMPQEGLRSRANYDRTKLLAEVEVRKGIERGLHAVILNPAHVIGRYDRKNWSRMILMVAEDRLPGIAGGSGTFAPAARVAEAHVSAVDHGRTGENYLLGGVDATFVEVIEIIGELTGRPVPRRAVPAPVLKIIAHLQSAAALVTGREPDVTPEVASMVTCRPRVESEKARRELGYRTETLRWMLEDCVEWMTSEGLLQLGEPCPRP